jgi:hypothetical protein
LINTITNRISNNEKDGSELVCMPKSFIIIDEGEDVKEMVKDGIRKRILLFPPYIYGCPS